MTIRELAAKHRNLFRVQPNRLKTFLEKQPHLTPEHIMKIYKIGTGFFNKRLYEKAEEVFYNLTLLEFKNPIFWKAWAVSLLLQKKFKEALNAYFGAHLLNPNDIEILSAMADCCLKIGYYDGAEEFLTQVCEIFEEKGVREDLYLRAKTLLTMLTKNIQ